MPEEGLRHQIENEPGLGLPGGSGWSWRWERRPRLLPHRLLWRLNRLLRPAPLLRRPRPPRWRRMPWRPSAARRRSAGELWLVSKLPARGRKKAASGGTRGKLLYGKHEIKRESIPMSTLELDMGTVIVKGDVFAVDHRELKKRGAWVVCFDVTDYTGSVRVSKFFPR